VPDHGSDDHGSDGVDARARAALDALRSGGEVESLDGVAVGWLDRARDLLSTAHLPGPPWLLGIAAVVAVAAVLGAGAWALQQASSGTAAPDAAFFSPPATTPAADGSTTATSGAPAVSAAPAVIVVHAAGAVVRPGLHELPAGARVADLLDAAGGPSPDADPDRLNLAAPLADGQRLYVPRVGETAPAVVGPDGSGAGGSGSSDPGGGPAAPVDLNVATVDQLDELPGVGPATATAIVEHRSRNGAFTSVDDLLDVRGIGPAKLEALRDLVTVG
jgi:competence protein ComEA